MSKNTEAGQSAGESAGDPVRNNQVEGCYRPFAEPDQEDRNRKDYQNRDEPRCDWHIQLPTLLLPTPARLTSPEPARSGLRRRQQAQPIRLVLRVRSG